MDAVTGGSGERRGPGRPKKVSHNIRRKSRGKGSHQMLTLEQKRRAVNLLDSGWTVNEVAAQTGCAPRTVRDWKANGERIREAHLRCKNPQASVRSGRLTEFPGIPVHLRAAVDKIIVDELLPALRNFGAGMPYVSVSCAAYHAADMVCRANGIEFAASGTDRAEYLSTQQVQKFLRRHCLRSVKVDGEGGDADTGKARPLMSYFRLLLRHMDAWVYNADETGHFFRRMPRRVIVPEEDVRNSRGTKAMTASERLTVMVAFDSTGEHKVPLFVIGNRQKPRCFEAAGGPRLPYKANSTAWMTSSLAMHWLSSVFLRHIETQHMKTSLCDLSATPPAAPWHGALLLFLHPNSNRRIKRYGGLMCGG